MIRFPMSFLLKADRSPGLGGGGDGTRVLHRGGRRQDEGVESHGERGSGGGFQGGIP